MLIQSKQPPTRRFVNLALILSTLCSCGALGSDMFSRILQPIRPGTGSVLSTDARWTDSASAGKKDIDLYRWRLFWVESRARTQNHEWFYSISYSAFDIGGELVLPDTGTRIDDTLQDVEAGLGYRAMRGQDIYGVFANLGSASDKPFDSYDETSTMLNAFYKLNRNRQSSWLFLVNYSNRRSFLNNVPIPGAAYVYAPDRRQLIIIGMPFFMLRYPLGERADVSLRYFIPDQIDLAATVKIARGFSLVAGATRKEDSYFLANRGEVDNQLYYEESRLYSGVKWSTRSGSSVSLTAGCAIDRRFYQGEEDDSDLDRVGVGDAADIRLSATHSF